jgi:outer membrane receptor protein involved in Fe transport
MKKLLLLFTVLSTVGMLQAQMPGMGNGKMQAPPSIGRVYGKLVDSAGKGIRDAYVVVLHNRMDTVTHKMKEVLLKGVSTQVNGDFNLEGLPIFGQLKLNITSVGYEAVTKAISFDLKKPAGATGGNPNGQMPDMSAIAANFEKDLGNITLKTDNKQLQQVTVTATSRMHVDIDKKVFNVGQNIVSAGGTAVEVMKNVPSVNVDIDGNVTLRNATPQLYIDGRPTTLTLDQIPADAIESVEVITNPSAKYDASGGNAGILNIVLKKNKKSGYNGNINAGVDKRGGINGGASINVRQNKFNVSLAGFTNQMKNHNTGTTNIRSLLTNPNVLVDQQTETRNNNQFLFGKAGIDYFATNRTTFSLSLIKVHGEFKPRDFLRTDSAVDNGSYISYSERNTQTHREFNAYGVQGGFKYSFPKKGEELTADFNIFSGKNNNNAYYNTNTYESYGGLQKGNIQQQILGSGTNKFTTLQTDYVKPLSATAKLETGARVQLRKLSNGQANYYLNQSTGLFEQVSSSASNYKSTDNVYAAYLSFSNSVKDFGYQVGLRAESSDYQGELTDSKKTFSNKYPISLFPSLFLSQKLNGKQELQLSYTRRINRPFFMQVIPFIDSTDQLNWSQGNAGLKPEFTNSLEASYSKTYAGNNTFLASVYYKYTTNLIAKYLDTITIGTAQHPVTTYVNANYSRSIGMELTTQNTVTSWWDFNANINLYNSRINTNNVSGTSQDALWSWFGKTNNNFKLPAKFKLQLSGTYQSKTNLPVNNNNNNGPGNGPPMNGSQSATQGYIKSNWGVDAALQKSFLKNDAASITFNVSDIFRTRRYDQYSVSDYYILNSHRLNDVPMFRLNFSFRFGQMDMSLFKRKNTKGDSESMQGAMQMQ